jgi:Domain of unknown function (DUF4160)
MPTICVFEGIRILMFYREHQPPHFHVERADESAEIGIDPIIILEGSLARSTRGKVFEWAAIHQAELRAKGSWLALGCRCWQLHHRIEGRRIG